MDNTEINKIFKFKACGCSPPYCPTIEVVQDFDIDGKYNVIIADDYSGVCQMTVDEFAVMCHKFMSVYNTGVYSE